MKKTKFISCTIIKYIPISCLFLVGTDIIIKVPLVLEHFLAGYFGGSFITLGSFLFWDKINKGKKYQYMHEYKGSDDISEPKYFWYFVIIVSFMFFLSSFDKKTTTAMVAGLLVGGAGLNILVNYCKIFKK